MRDKVKTKANQKSSSTNVPTLQRSSLPTRGRGSEGEQEVPPIVYEALRSPGQPLDAVTRAFFEPRFGHDFSHVRVHMDAKAAESARTVNALAYTVGRDVVFGAGQNSLVTAAGKRLLAHELAHVIQQRGLPPRVQRKPDPKSRHGVQFSYSVRINSVLDSDQLLIEFIKQYRGVETDEEAAALRDRENWHWVGSPPSVKEIDASKGYILIPVNDLSITLESETEKKERDNYFKALSQEEQEAINAEVDRQFWKRTGYRVGQKLGTSTDDKKMADYWRVLRNELVQMRQAIHALPPDIQKFIFDEKASLSLDPKDFETVLRIASTVSALTTAEIAEYKSRTTAEVIDFSAYEAAINRFIAERKEREATAEEHQKIETRLYGMEVLYDRYRNYVSMLKSHAMLSGLGTPDTAGTALGAQLTINRLRSELEADLIKAGFPGGIADFEMVIRDYEKVFERETHAIAKVMLDQYEHVLCEEEKKYKSSVAAALLYQSVIQTPAKKYYQEAEELTISAWMSAPPAGAAGPQPQVETKLARATEIRKQAESEVIGAATNHPLVLASDFNRKQLAQAADPTEVQSIMLSYIAARKKDIADTHNNLNNKPAMIYGLDTLIKASFRAQNIQSGTIYEKIISNHISDIHWMEAIPQIILGVIAVAAGLFTGGGGTVAVLAAGTALGISAYQAIEEFRRFEMMSASKGAQLASEDPSMVWVIVAVIGAGIDAAAFASVLPKLRPTIEAFNTGSEAGNVAALEQKLSKLSDVEEGIRTSIVRAAETEAEARAAWKAVFRPSTALRMVIVPGAEEFGRFVYAVYLTIKRGIREFRVFVKTNEAIDLIGDVTKLTAEELAILKSGYLKAIEEMEKIALQGKALGMTDNEIRAFMNLRGNTKGMTIEQVLEEISAMKALKETGLSIEVTEKQWARLRQVSEALSDETKWVNIGPKDRWRLGRVYDSLLEKLISEGIRRTGQRVMHYTELNAEMVKRLRSTGGRVLITEGRIPTEGLRIDMIEIDFIKGRAELIDLAATSSPEHLKKTLSYKVAVEKLLGMPVEAKELYYTGSKGELLETLVEVLVK